MRRSPQSGPVCQPHSTQDPTPDGCRPSSTEVWLAAVTCTRASPRAAVSQPEASVIITSQIGGGGRLRGVVHAQHDAGIAASPDSLVL